MIWLYSLLGWEVCGLLAYILFQYTQRKHIYPYKWTLKDRVGCSSAGAILGPIWLFASIWIYFDTTVKWDKEVKW